MAYNRNMNNARYMNRNTGYAGMPTSRMTESCNKGCAPVNVQPADCGCGCEQNMTMNMRSDFNDGECCMTDRMNSDCQKNDLCIDSVFSKAPIGMTYVPWQSFGDLYCDEKALMRGTIFKELDLEFLGRRVKQV